LDRVVDWGLQATGVWSPSRSPSLYPAHAPKADRTTARRCAPLPGRHARIFAETNSIKKDEIAACQLHALRQHYAGKLKLIDVREMFLQMRDRA